MKVLRNDAAGCRFDASSSAYIARQHSWEDDMAYASPAYRRVLCRDLEALEAELELTATAGARSPWVERLRDRVRLVRERLQVDRKEH